MTRTVDAGTVGLVPSLWAVSAIRQCLFFFAIEMLIGTLRNELRFGQNLYTQVEQQRFARP